MIYSNHTVLFPALRLNTPPAQMAQTIFATNKTLEFRVLEVLQYATVQEYNQRANRPMATSHLKKQVNTYLKNFYGARFKIAGPAYYTAFRDELHALLPPVYRQYQLSYA